MPSQPLRTALDAIEQKPEHANLDTPPTLEEVHAAIKAMRNGKTQNNQTTTEELDRTYVERGWFIEECNEGGVTEKKRSGKPRKG